MCAAASMPRIAGRDAAGLDVRLLGAQASSALADVPDRRCLGIAYVTCSCLRPDCQVPLRQFMIMRWLLSFLVLAIVAVVRAASFTGNRLLVVVEEQAEREKYSVFLEDLAGKCNSRY